MKVARIAVAVIALGAGLAAAFLVAQNANRPPVVVVQPPPTAAPPPGPPTSEVLVATQAIGVGNRLNERNIEWRRWPDDAVGPYFIRRAQRPNAREELRGAFARAALAAGEPVNEARLIRADRSGFMAAILPSGMRAVTVPITAETGVGGFILPNDRVDILSTRRDRDPTTNRETVVATTILRNVRVLAIDQNIQERDGERTVTGRTATFELNPRQAEIVAAGRQRGDLSLALRSIAEAAEAPEQEEQATSSSISVVRYGVPSTATVTGR